MPSWLTPDEASALIERACIRTVDGGFSDEAAIVQAFMDMPLPCFDAIFMELKQSGWAEEGLIVEACHRWYNMIAIRKAEMMSWLRSVLS